MSLNLRRDEAPLSAAAWAEVDEEARRVLELSLAARKLVDFRGPLGWQTSAVGLGRTEPLSDPNGDVELHARRSQPLIELRVPFSVALAEAEAIDRGAEDADLDPVIEAALKFAGAEDRLVFDGLGAAGVTGIVSGSPHPPMPIASNYQNYPHTVALALHQLEQAGVAGPFGIALGPRCYAGLMQAPSDGGYPVYTRLERVLRGGPIVRAPTVDGAVVLSLREGDFALFIGQDISIGYTGHDRTHVHLYLVQSLTFRNLGPEAAVALVYT